MLRFQGWAIAKANFSGGAGDKISPVHEVGLRQLRF
jgi:hypothetical protein